MIPNASIKGNMDLIILSALVSADRYGYEITKQISGFTNGEIILKEGSLYPALHKLEKQGYIEGYWSQNDPGKPGRKYYKLTDQGRLFIEEEREKWISFIGTIRRIIYGEQYT